MSLHPLTSIDFPKKYPELGIVEFRLDASLRHTGPPNARKPMKTCSFLRAALVLSICIPPPGRVEFV